MSEIEPKEKNKKAVANEIVMIFKKVKLSILMGIIFFIGYSIYSNLVSYSFFDKDFAWFEAEEILGYKPSQYNFVPNENQSKEFGAPTYGSMEISDESRVEVKKEIINKLVEESSIFTLIMVPITFGILLLTHYVKKTINWTKKYAD